MGHIVIGDAVVELPPIPHDRVEENGRSVRAGSFAIVAHEFALFSRCEEADEEGIEGKSQFIPHRKSLLHVIGGVKKVEFPVVEGVRHESRGKRGHVVLELTEHRYHRGERNFPIVGHVADEQDRRFFSARRRHVRSFSRGIGTYYNVAKPLLYSSMNSFSVSMYSKAKGESCRSLWMM